MLVDEDSSVLLVSRRGMSIRFQATDDALRPMGRSTSGVIGMHFRESDSLLSASVVSDSGSVFVVTEGGYAKRTAVDQYRAQGRGGLGIKVAKLNDERGVLAGALIVDDDDEVLVVLASGKVVRSAVAEVPAKGRDTMGVVFARFDDDDKIIALAKNSERNLDAADDSPCRRRRPRRPRSGCARRRGRARSMSSVAEKLQRKDQRSVSSKQVRLKLVYVDFWSVVKLSFLIWLCLGIVLIVASILIWVVLYSTGIFGKLDGAMQDILSDPTFSIANSFGLGQVGLFTFVVAILNTVIGTVLGAVASLLYNLSVRITGGLLVGFQNS